MRYRIIQPSEYPESTIECARWLLGKVIVRQHYLDRLSTKHLPSNPAAFDTDFAESAGVIIETEAYLSTDPASHSFNGKTLRNESMYLPAGSWYVYLIYGVHFCLNLVTQEEGVAEAVLIRALFPIQGVPEMRRQRGLSTEVASDKLLCNGPGKLCQAMNIGKKHDGTSSCNGAGITLAELENEVEVPGSGNRRMGKRIGISRNRDLEARFYFDAPGWVARPPKY